MSGEAQDGRTVSGLTLFLNGSQADRRTARVDSQVSAGAVLTWPFRGAAPGMKSRLVSHAPR